MTLEQRVLNAFETLTDKQKAEVVDLAEALKQKNDNYLEKLMDEVIFENKEALEELAK